MKKLFIAFLILPFTTAWADLILTNKTLVPTQSVSEPAPAPTSTAVAGVVPNSMDLIWADAFGTNQGDPAYVSKYYPLFSAVPRTFPLDGSFPKTNGWYEIMEGGDGTSCGYTTNAATNTVVEVGRISAWIYYEVGGWVQYLNTTTRAGMNQPNASGDPYATVEGYYGCPTTGGAMRLSHMGYDTKAGFSAAGLGLYKPNYAWIWHGWGDPQVTIDYSKNPKAVLVTMYARLVVQNPSLPDDRDKANYVIHISADKKSSTGITTGDIGISRWKRITKDWQPINFLTGGWTKAQFQATNPPITTNPY